MTERVAKQVCLGCVMVAAALVVTGNFSPGTAAAATCPAAPAAYGGADPVVAELRAERIAHSATCDALREQLQATVSYTYFTQLALQSQATAAKQDTQIVRLTELRDRLADGTFKIDLDGTQTVRLDQAVANLVRLESVAGVAKGNVVSLDKGDTSGNPLHVSASEATPTKGRTDAEPAYVKLASSDATAPTLESGFNSSHSTLWFLAGLLVSLVAGSLIVRRILP